MSAVAAIETRAFPDVAAMSTREASLAYSRAGFLVFPLRPGTKEPAVNWTTDAFTRPEEVAALWPADDDHGIGLPLSANGLVAIDVDTPPRLPAELADALAASSTARQSTDILDADRAHYVFSTGERWSNSTASFTGSGWGDVRGSGYIAVAPTRHPRETGHYVWTDLGIAALPGDIAAWLRPANAGTSEADSADVDGFLSAYTAKEEPERLTAGLEALRARVAAGEPRNPLLMEYGGRMLREAVAGCYDARAAYAGIVSAVQPYEDGRAEAALARIIGAVAAEDPEEIRREYRPRLHVIKNPAVDREEEFWNSRLALSTTRDFARARLAAPWAVLGAVLTRVIAETPYNVCLPPIVGSKASLNLFVALVGPSGSGKDAASAVARELLPIREETPSFQVGSGEGLIHTFARAGKDEEGGQITEWIRRNAQFTVSEVDQLTALTGGRSGSTLLPLLRQAWSGVALGRTTASTERNVSLDAHAYRLTLTVGVQPGRAEALFADADGGTPQRFLWLPATDPQMADGYPDPTPLHWVRPMAEAAREGKPDVFAGSDEYLIEVCATARQEIRDDRIRRGRGHPTDLNGHALLARLKVSAALAILEGRYSVTESDWKLGGVIMAKSDETRLGIQEALRRSQDDAAQQRGKAAGVAKAIADTTEADVKTTAAAVAVRRRLDGGGWQTRAALRRSLNAVHRPYFDDAVAVLARSGAVSERPTESGQGREYSLNR